jgi:hypothetical protein
MSALSDEEVVLMSVLERAFTPAGRRGNVRI